MCSCHNSPENHGSFSLAVEDWIVTLRSCPYNWMKNHSSEVQQPHFLFCMQTASLANKMEADAVWCLGEWLCPQTSFEASMMTSGMTSGWLPPCSKGVSPRRQQMQCNYYGYKVDRGFLKTSTLTGRPHLLESWGWVFKLEIYIGMSRERTIFPQLVSLYVCPGKQDLQRIQDDFPRNSIFW